MVVHKDEETTIRQVQMRGRAKVNDVFTIAMLAVNLRRLLKLFAMRMGMAGAGNKRTEWVPTFHIHTPIGAEPSSLCVSLNWLVDADLFATVHTAHDFALAHIG